MKLQYELNYILLSIKFLSAILQGMSDFTRNELSKFISKPLKNIDICKKNKKSNKKKAKYRYVRFSLHMVSLSEGRDVAGRKLNK